MQMDWCVHYIFGWCKLVVDRSRNVRKCPKFLALVAGQLVVVVGALYRPLVEPVGKLPELSEVILNSLLRTRLVSIRIGLLKRKSVPSMVVAGIESY